MQYHMLTAYGTSSETNHHSPTSPVHGSGQGSTSPSTEWTFNADIILKCFSDQANRCIIKDPINTIIQERNADMIVDDATMQHNAGQYNLDARTLMNICQQDITLWDELLWANGGLLETLKTSYFLMVWNFDNTGCQQYRQKNLYHQTQFILPEREKKYVCGE
eukprot:15355961-Ditylum_brightwellii.AAC.1